MTSFIANPLPDKLPVPEGQPVAIGSVNAKLAHTLGPLVKGGLDVMPGPADVVVLCVPAGAGVEVAAWLTAHFSLAAVEGEALTVTPAGAVA